MNARVGIVNGAIVVASFTAFLSMGPVSVLAVEQPGGSTTGEPVHGLHVTLVSASSTWAIGTTMAFEATLRNVGDQPFLVDVFGDVDELYTGKHASEYVTSCWTFTWHKTLGPPGPRKGPVPFDPSQFVRLQPGESYTKHLTFTLPTFPLGVYRIRLAYVPRPASPSFRFPKGWVEEFLPSDPLWVGMAFSNELTLEVIEAPASAIQ